uniref:Neurotensin receptor 1 n=1 Tax=Callorhinchus milii TaxID=7868 RepID=A0A4W3JFJ2_CALMI
LTMNLTWSLELGNGLHKNALYSEVYPATNGSNATRETSENDLDVNTDVYSKITVTLIYIGLFLIGSMGNFITMYTLVKKKTLQNLQSTVHYHLANLAFSDLLILILSMPIELYNFIWFHHPWAFGDTVCRGYYFLRDACTYATALNIASLSIERYMAICHPFKAKTIMSTSRTKKLISAIWVLSLVLATPMLFTMGEKHINNDVICTTIVEESTIKTVIQVNAFLSFVLPMVVISVLNTIIANQLIAMFKQAAQDSRVCTIGGQQTMLSISVEPSRIQSLQHGVKCVCACVFGLCVSVGTEAKMLIYQSVTWSVEDLYNFYHYFYMVTNVLFYVSSTINPVLYNLVSANFRQNFLSILSYFCFRWREKSKAPPLNKKSNSLSSNHNYSSSITKETVY